jgi:ABC-2 type transport system permease protein
MDRPFLIRLLGLFRGPFQWMGVNADQLLAIVEIKLMMDNRRQIVAYRKKESAEPSNSFLITLFFYTIFGGFITLGIANIPSFILGMILFFSYIMVMIAMTLITDFSSILLDTSDNTIILPRPVNSRTLYISRLMHILLYLAQIMVGLVLVPSAFIWLKYGFVVLLFFIAGTTFSVITGIFVTNAFYLLILQFANEEKLKNVINYFQIMMAIVVMGSYQILPRMLGRFDLEDYVFEYQWWNYFVPPIWMAAAMEAVYYQLTDLQHLVLSIMAITLPILGIYLVNKYLTPVFGRKLGIIGVDNSPSVKPAQKGKSNFVQRISGRITKGNLERGAFELVYSILSRDRKIKLKIYPSIGYILIFGLIFLMRDRQSLESTWESLPQSDYFLVLIYLAFMVLQITIFEIPYSDDFKASWIYFSTPLARPGEILTAMMKAVIVRLFIPIYLVLSIVLLFIWKWYMIDDIIVGFFNNIIMLLIIVLIGKRQLPFSVAPTARNQSGNFIRSMMMLALIALVGISHYLLAKFPMVMLAVIPVQCILIYFMHEAYRKTSWSRLSL